MEQTSEHAGQLGLEVRLNGVRMDNNAERLLALLERDGPESADLIRATGALTVLVEKNRHTGHYYGINQDRLSINRRRENLEKAWYDYKQVSLAMNEHEREKHALVQATLHHARELETSIKNLQVALLNRQEPSSPRAA